jgi:hypothetical protein
MKRICILLASGFSEKIVVTLTTTLRDAGFGVTLVGIALQPVRGQHGMEFVAEISLGTLSLSRLPKMVIVPGGQSCSRILLQDPRAMQLIHKIVTHGGWLALTRNTAYKDRFKSSDVYRDRTLIQEVQTTCDFANSLVEKLKPGHDLTQESADFRVLL